MSTLKRKKISESSNVSASKAWYNYLTVLEKKHLYSKLIECISFSPTFREPIVNVTRQPQPSTAAPTIPPRTPAPTPRAPKAIAAAPAPSKNCNPRVTNVEFEGKHYFVQWKNRFATKYTWDGAKNSCAKIGMKMISMDNPAKREFFLNMLERDHYEYFWAGGKISRCV